MNPNEQDVTIPHSSSARSDTSHARHTRRGSCSVSLYRCTMNTPYSCPAPINIGNAKKFAKFHDPGMPVHSDSDLPQNSPIWVPKHAPPVQNHMHKSSI